MHIARITNATHTHTHTHTQIHKHKIYNIYCFSGAKRLRERALILRLYLHLFTFLLYCVAFFVQGTQKQLILKFIRIACSVLGQSDITINDLQPVTLLLLYMTIFSPENCFSESSGFNHGQGKLSSLKCHINEILLSL